MQDEPTFTIRASDPGAAKALRQLAAEVRVTNPTRAAEIDALATGFAEFASRRRQGAGFIPKR